MNFNLEKQEKPHLIQKLNKKDLIIFLIPSIIFLFYLTIYNPGILGYDAYYQLHEIATNNFDNWHPFFHTFIEMMCLKVYDSPISICILQIFTFSSMWMIICKYNRQEFDGNNLTEDRTFIIQVIITTIICLIPINALYSITLWKDILFSYFLMFLCFLIKVMLDKEFKVDIKFIIVLSLTMAIVSQIRGNGLYLILVFLVILGIYLFIKDRTQKLYLIIPALTIIFILLLASLNIVYDVQEHEKDPVFTKISHMLADYDLNIEMSDVDKDKVHRLMNETAIKENYNIYFSDPIYRVSDVNVYNANKNTYIELALKYSLQNPLHFIHYVLESSAITWDITRDSDWKGGVYYPDYDGECERFYSTMPPAPNDYNDEISKNKGTAGYDFLNSIVETFKHNHILDTLFHSPALYMYLTILLMIMIHYITHSKKIYLVYLPNLINIFVIIPSIPVQDTRYLYPNILLFYLMLIIFIGVKEKINLKNIKAPYYPKNTNKDYLKEHNQDLQKPLQINDSISNIKLKIPKIQKKYIIGIILALIIIVSAGFFIFNDPHQVKIGDSTFKISDGYEVRDNGETIDVSNAISSISFNKNAKGNINENIDNYVTTKKNRDNTTVIIKNYTVDNVIVYKSETVNDNSTSYYWFMSNNNDLIVLSTWAKNENTDSLVSEIIRSQI